MKIRSSPRLKNPIFRYYNEEYFVGGVHNLQVNQKVIILNKVRPAQGNIVTEEDKIATIIGFTQQRIHLKTDNGLITTRKYKHVKAA